MDLQEYLDQLSFFVQAAMWKEFLDFEIGPSSLDVTLRCLLDINGGRQPIFCLWTGLTINPNDSLLDHVLQYLIYSKCIPSRLIREPAYFNQTHCLEILAAIIIRSLLSTLATEKRVMTSVLSSLGTDCKNLIGWRSPSEILSIVKI